MKYDWIHTYGVCPVDSDTVVDVMFRYSGPSLSVFAKDVRWQSLDVIAYRVTEQENKNDTQLP